MSIKRMKPFQEEKLGWMAATFDSVSDLVLIADLDDRIVYANPAAIKKFGFSLKELLAQKGSLVMSPKNPKSTREEMLKATHENPNGWEGEIINLTKDGHEFRVHLKTALVRNKKGEPIGMTGISRDITDRIKAREEREEYTRQLEAVNETLKKTQAQLVRSEKLAAIGVLASGIAHEIGNPLASISSLVELLQRKVKSEKQKKSLILMETHIQRITKIIQNVRDFSKWAPSALMAVDLEPLLKRTIQRLREERKNKQITVKLNSPMDLPRVRGEAGQLTQVFLNVLTNAWDAVKEMGTISVDVKKEKDMVAVIIADDGKGISKDARRKVFEPFFTTQEVGKGAGLGLSVAYGIVKSFGGNIRVESVLGKGTQFKVYLPIYNVKRGNNGTE